MAVRKKLTTTSIEGDKMDLSRELEQVRASIITLPTDEGAIMETESTETSTTKPAKKLAKKPAKKLAKKPAKKLAKKPAKKPAKKAEAANTVTLEEVCKPLEVDPRNARRYLRDAKLKNPGRWSFLKGSAELKRATDVIKAGISE